MSKPTSILNSLLNIYLLQCSFIVLCLFSVHNASNFFRFSARFRMGFFFQTKHLWNCSSYISLWIVRFIIVWCLNWLKIAHIYYKECLMFVFDRIKLPNIKNGLLLSTPPRSFKHVKTSYKVENRCLVWLAICDPLIPTLLTQQCISFYQWQLSFCFVTIFEYTGCI